VSPVQRRRLDSRAGAVAVRLLMLLLVLGAAPLRAQDPPPPGTVPPRADTIPPAVDTVLVPIPPEQVAPDTLPRTEEPEDTLRPAPNLPVFPRTAAAGFAEARWEWDSVELGRWHGMSILALLEQIPGLLVTRAGWYGRPAGLAAFGLGGDRVRVFLDGFELDPLGSATFDLQHIAVVDLESVRVERLLTETRVELFTFRLPDQRAYSQLEAGTAIFNTRILRGLFATRTGSRGLLTLGLDISDTDGWLRQQPYSVNTLLGRWSYNFGGDAGVQAEFRQTDVERAGAPFALSGVRRDLVLRGRARPLPNLAVDALFGRSTRSPGEVDTLAMDLSSVQGALRARADLGPAWLGAGAQLRNAGRTGFAEPTLQLSTTAGVQPVPWVRAHGELSHARVADVSGTELQSDVRLGPLAGFSLFAGAATGSRGVGIARDTTLLIPAEPIDAEEPGEPTQVQSFVFPAITSQVQAFRAGAEWRGWGARLGAAYLAHDVDSIAPFGLAFDRTTPPALVLPSSAIEAFGSIPLLYQPLRLEGSYTHWLDTGGRPYLPEQHGRLALVFSQQFYEGNLEPTLRIEAVRRGSALVPTEDRQAFGAFSAPYTMFNLFLQIRILDVRAFLIWDNLLNDMVAADLPGRTFGGQRAIYGVRWHFFD
jgi:hypothetical protein